MMLMSYRSEHVQTTLTLHPHYTLSMSEVIPRLYISGVNPAKNLEWLRDHGITHIVNAAHELPNYFPTKFYYLSLSLHDRADEDISHVFEPSRKFISDALANPNNAVLVHCFMGMSRSASVVTYYLMSRLIGPPDARLYYALWQLRSKHSLANPNRGYMLQLSGRRLPSNGRM